MRETAGDKWLAEIEALKREVFQVVNNDNRSGGERDENLLSLA